MLVLGIKNLVIDKIIENSRNVSGGSSNEGLLHNHAHNHAHFDISIHFRFSHKI